MADKEGSPGKALSPGGSSTVSLSAIENSVAASSNEIKKTPKDFMFIKTIGEGSFSTVYVGKEVDTGREFASTIFL